MSRMIEELESRTFLSAEPVYGPFPAAPLAQRVAAPQVAETYNLMSLLGYDQLGASWSYDTEYSVKQGSTTNSGSDTLTVSVGDGTTRLDGRPCNNITVEGAQATVKTAWYTAPRLGVNQMLSASTNNLGTVTARLHGVRLSPATMIIGRRYADSGTFNGTFRMESGARVYTGSLSGQARAASQLLGNEHVVVPAGEYDAVKGKYLVRLGGKLRIRYRGKTYTANYTSVVSQNFWAVQGNGVVKSEMTATTIVSVPGEGRQKVVTTTTSELT